MTTSYKQLTQPERYQIEALCKLDYSARSVALQLGRSNKTISNELSRFEGRIYCAHTAHQQSVLRSSTAKKTSKCHDAMKALTHSLLLIGLSPEQISGRMDKEKHPHNVSRTTIYSLVARLGWQHLLARKGKTYRKGTKATAGAKLIPNRVDIAERPSSVDDKQEIGHWEADTVYGQDGYLVTLVERVSKLLLTCRVKNKTKQAVTEAINGLLKPFTSHCLSITFDNGGEFAGHEAIKKALKCDTFFARPYHSWERGLNENTNGLLRRFFPKGMAIACVPEAEIEQAQFMINIRPRKTLNYLSPYEFITGKRVSLIAGI